MRFAVIALLAAGCEEVPIEPPRPLGPPSFLYPEELWDAGVEGETLLRVYVDESGAADSARVDRSSGFAPFDSAALLGAARLRFEPARQGEASVGTWVRVPVRFRLQPGSSSPQ